MKKILIAIIAIAVALIVYKVLTKSGAGSGVEDDEKKPKVHTGADAFRIGDGRLKDSWVKMDGVYKLEEDGRSYYMRFYPQGNVTLVAGMEQVGISLKPLLVQDAPPGVNMVHNTMTRIEGDSLFFDTKGPKGVIRYLGARVNGNPNHLRFLKHSLINGRKGFFEYKFEQD